jgi:hypothetical protein
VGRSTAHGGTGASPIAQFPASRAWPDAEVGRSLDQGRDMIVVQVVGGLGNQMFQYAFGRRLADGLGVPLKLDITSFRTYAKRRYELGGLCVEEEFASDREIARMHPSPLARARSRAARLFPSLAQGPGPIVRERAFSFDPSMLELRDGVYLEGYWQSERYFDAVADRLRVEFVPRMPLEGRAALLADEMRSGDSVSLHVRRGDYVSEPPVSQVHLVCDPDYYARCVRHMSERFDDARYYVFSDEPGWARDNLRLPRGTTIVADRCCATAVHEMWLMAQCRHHVIANSSFSWWGAWLDSRPSKVVLMPRRWFRDREPECTTDIRPSGWVAL